MPETTDMSVEDAVLKLREDVNSLFKDSASHMPAAQLGSFIADVSTDTDLPDDELPPALVELRQEVSRRMRSNPNAQFRLIDLLDDIRDILDDLEP